MMVASFNASGARLSQEAARAGLADRQDSTAAAHMIGASFIRTSRERIVP